MGTTYKELADSVFDKIKSYDFLDMTEDEAYNVVFTYIRPSIVRFENCRQDLSDRDDTVAAFNITLTDDTFEILVRYMVVEWLESNYIFVWDALQEQLSSSSFKKVNTKDMLTRTTALRDQMLRECKQLSINKAFKKTATDLYDIATGSKSDLE